MAKRRDRKARERRFHYRLMHRIYKLCAQGEWRLRYARIRKNGKLCRGHGLGTNTVGFVDVEPQIIWVDHREDAMMTFIHECLHVLMGDRYLNRPKAEEREVQRLERLMKRHLSARQARRLHMHMANMLVAEEQ
ncbi:MAG TPA: hypothetical protein VL500_05715 [Candidatus Eisenbacteria bacterium]|jgi:hypothetical protein|nr:hypothetical protein [Candidatus Eisenbacteria bacterium]